MKMPIKRYSIKEIKPFFGMKSYNTWYDLIAHIKPQLINMVPEERRGKISKRYTIAQVIFIKNELKDMLLEPDDEDLLLWQEELELMERNSKPPMHDIQSKASTLNLDLISG